MDSARAAQHIVESVMQRRFATTVIKASYWDLTDHVVCVLKTVRPVVTVQRVTDASTVTLWPQKRNLAQRALYQTVRHVLTVRHVTFVWRDFISRTIIPAKAAKRTAKTATTRENVSDASSEKFQLRDPANVHQTARIATRVVTVTATNVSRASRRRRTDNVWTVVMVITIISEHCQSCNLTQRVHR